MKMLPISLKPLLTIILLCCFSLIANLAFSAVTLPTIFGDNMIFQQNAKNAIWGFADAGEKVTVKASWGAQATATADKNGDWKAFLDTPGYGLGFSLKVMGTNTVTIENVAIGEVWLCFGQSNLGWALLNTFGSEEEAATANVPELRIYKSGRQHWHEERKDCISGAWVECTPETAMSTSAVSYYFARKLQKELGIPVGIIVQAYAGTPIEGWLPVSVQKDDPRYAMHKANYDNAAKRQDSEESALKTFYEEWEKYIQEKPKTSIELFTTNVKPPIITKPATLGHQYPAHIFNGMVYPVRP